MPVLQLIYQNERLKKKVCSLKKENSDLKRRLNEYCEAEKRSELLRQYATMRECVTSGFHQVLSQISVMYTMFNYNMSFIC